jgi:hypothetical protein
MLASAANNATAMAPMRIVMSRTARPMSFFSSVRATFRSARTATMSVCLATLSRKALSIASA